MSGKYALIIANTEYTDSGLSQLEAPGKDARELERVLFSPDICAFNDVIVLYNEVASKVKETVEHFLSDRKPTDLLLIYFSGHGVRDVNGSLYLAVKNTNRSRLRSTAIESDFIRDIMDQSRSKRQILILDCCNSGAFARGTKAETGGSIGTASAFEGTGYGRVVLTASDSTQFAWEGDKLIQGEMENSLFTNFLVKGLEGNADNDGDGRVTIDELYDYAYEQIVNITSKQTPGKWSYKQQGEIILRQKIRVEDTRPVPLPEDLVDAINNSLPYIREGAVRQLESLLKGKNLSLARSARIALEKMAAEDDSKYVAQAATKALASIQTKREEIQATAPKPAVHLGGNVHEPATTMEGVKQEIVEEMILPPVQNVPEHQKETPSAGESFTAPPRVQKLDAQLPASKFPIKWFGIATAAILILAVGYAVTALRPSGSSSSPPLDTRVPSLAPTEEIPPATESLLQVPITSEDTATPTVEPTIPTPTLEETLLPTVVTLLPEITDEMGVPLVLVSEGEFMMGDNRGDDDERPLHPVELVAFYIDKYEVTNGFYKACERAGVCEQPHQLRSATRNSYYLDVKYNNYPVIYVDWEMAKAYCEWRGAKLPTEAQWEKAARGTDQRTYPWGEDITCQVANYRASGCLVDTSEVGSYPDGKSPYGAYDMAGNVYEWVADRYSGNYYKSQSFFSNPTGPETGMSRVQRGGSFASGFDKSNAANRFPYAPTENRHDLGFRCARPLQ